MPKLIPVPDALSKPFWDAVNQRRLVLQHCAACDRLQYPPQQACQVCNSAAGLTWKEVAGRGHIATYIVIEDGRLNRRMPDQPYNLAMVTLDADPRPRLPHRAGERASRSHPGPAAGARRQYVRSPGLYRVHLLPVPRLRPVGRTGGVTRCQS